YDEAINFKVENYRKPEYFIEAESKVMEVVRGDEIDVEVKGEYFSGQPLSSEVVNYKIFASQGFGDYDYYYPISASNFYHAWGQNEIETGSVTLDSKGKAKVSLATNKNDSLGKYQLYYVEFSYADATGNQNLTAVNVLVRSGEVSIYRDSDTGYGGKTNQKLDLPLIVKSNQKGVNLAQNIEIGVARRWWQKYNDENSKYPQYREEKENMGNFFVNSDKSGKAVFSFTPTKEGSYELNTKMTDKRGNVVVKTFYLWVSDKYANYKGENSNSTIRITTDKKKYVPGDKAIINISSDIPDRDIYFGVERAYQDRYQVVHMNGTSADVELMISEHDMPNIFLVAKSFEVTGLQGDIQNVEVDTSNKKITYTINTDKKLYSPGDEVTVNVEARDKAGNPVESNLALWAVDKSLYSLADVNYGDVFETFWQKRGDETQQSHSLEGITVIGGAEKGGCFLPGTKVLMANSISKPIEDIKVGDKILTRVSPKSAKMMKTKVTALHSTFTMGYFVINAELKLTGNHLLMVNGKWAEARTISIGDELIGIGDKKIIVDSIEFLNLPSKVYNLTTDTYHSFFAEGVYVHNDKGGGTRDNFADTAYWNASINTGSDGRTQVKFKLPDNLTTWVLTTIGASSDTKAGQGFTEIKVSKDLAIRPVLPNVLGERDTITVSALVNNYSELESKATVELVTNAGEVLSPLSQKVEVLANDFVQVVWQIKVGEAKEKVKFEFKVNDDKGRSDAVVQEIEVRSIGYWEQKSDFRSGSSTISLQVPNIAYDINKSKVEVALSSTVMGSLPTALKYLINYPYGCVEQTTSALVPKLMARKYPVFFAEALKSESKYQVMSEGFDKLRELQNYDGSWSWWWKGSKPEAFVSAYVFRILNEAKLLGISIDEGMYNKALRYLSENFDNVEFENKIIKAYGLSFATDSKYHRGIEGDLSAVSDDFLAMAVQANLTAGINDSSKSGLDLLLKRMTVTDSGVHWNAGSLERFGSKEASTALAIQALAKSGAHQDVAAKAINYLMKNRYHDYWGSTYTTAQTILAIIDYSLAVKESEANILYRVMSGGEQLASGMFSGSKTIPALVNIDLKLYAKNKEIRIEKKGEGELYTTVNQKWWIKDAKSPEVSNGVKIVKTIVNVKGEAYNFVPGDLVRVNLDVSFPDGDNIARGYAIIEDHLPSGLVPVNTRLLNESDNQSDDIYTEKQFLKDGVIIPIFYSGNTQRFSYLARIINAGTFYMPPAYYSQMYYPDTWARSESSSFMVEDMIRISALSGIKDIKLDLKNYLTLKNLVIVIFFTAMLGALAFWKKKKLKSIKNNEETEAPPRDETPESNSSI
ncbi:MAG TPA: alpha-2-macroglobulin family protein, partial [Candidatus Methanoperedens sp.]|nr:alpha-2-macroglobulin family protein [Candidatus Methanoperedens sp.]